MVLQFYPQPKTSIWLKKGDPPRRLPYGKHRFSRRPVLPGLARLCPDLRCRKAQIQAFSSRAGVQEGTRWQSTTPSNQNRILLKRRPHQNLIDNEIWTPWATFSTKSGVLIGLFLCFFLRFYPQPKTSIWLKKGGSSAQTPILKTSIPALPGFARLCPALPGFEVQENADPSLFLTRRSSGRHSLAKHNSLKPESHTPQV